MKQAASLKGLRLGMLLPGIAIDTSAADFAPLEQMLMMRFTGGQWKRFGSVLNGIESRSGERGIQGDLQVWDSDAGNRRSTKRQYRDDNDGHV